MKKTIAVLLSCAMLSPLVPWSPSLAAGADPGTEARGCARAAGRSSYDDDFNGTSLDPKWSWLNSPASYDVGSTTPGHLRMVARRGTNFSGTADNGAMLYQNISGDFYIETKLSANPQSNYEKAGLMMRQDGGNWVALKYQAENGIQVELSSKVGGSIVDRQLNATTANPVWLRLVRVSSSFSTYFSIDGINWTLQWTRAFNLNDSLMAGLLIADGNANTDFTADFDYFREGPPNRAPVIADPFTPISVNEDERAFVAIASHISDPDGDELDFQVMDSAHIQGAYNATLGDLQVWGAPNWFGAEFANIKATDRFGLFIKAQVRVTVAPVPDAPYLVKPIPDIVVQQGGVNSTTNLSKYFFDNDTLFGGSDALTYSVSGGGALRVDIAPSGIAKVAAPVDFWGTVKLTFTATDATGLQASVEALVSVFHVNQAPQVRSAPPDTSVNEDDSVSVNLGPVFWDPDGDPLTLEATGMSLIAVAFDRMNATFTPALDASGFKETITIRARDDKGLSGAPATINVTVVAVNDAPRITSFSPPANISLLENDALDFSVAATDPESGAGVTYSWSVDDAPAATGVTGFTFRTDYGSAGDHVVKVTVSDGELSTTQSWTITVKNVNREPAKVAIVAPKPGAVIKEGVSIQFEGDATDPDDDPLSFAWIEGPVELGTGRNFSTILPIGMHKIMLEVSDGKASARSTTISITVKENVKPTILSIEPVKDKKYVRGTTVPLTVEALDADGDRLIYCWTEYGRVLGTNQSIALSGLPVGKHRVLLAVSDGTAVAQATAEFEVVEPAVATADNSMLLIGGLLSVLVVVMVIAIAVRGKKKPPAKPAQLEQPVLKW